MGPVGEVEAGDLDGRPHADAATSSRGSPSRLHTSVAPTRPAPSQCVHSSTMLASTVRSASAARGARCARPGRPRAACVDHWMPSQVATPSGVDRRTQPRPRRWTTRAPVLTARCTADDSYSRVRSKHTSRSPPPTTRATNDDRPSARRRATASGMSEMSTISSDAGRLAAHRVGRGQQGAVAGGDALVGVGVAGVVQLGQQQGQQVVVVGQPDALVVELVAQPQHPAPVGVELGRRRRHGPQPARPRRRTRRSTADSSQLVRSLSATAGRSR